MVTLTLTEKGGDAKQLSFEKDEVTIGRVQGNDVVLAKGNVSKRHCRIFTQDGRYSVEDLKSTNGTYINGRKIGETTVVSATDKVYVGDFIIKVESAALAGSVSSPPIGPEAGSLSAAIPRRPPPPPPARSTRDQRVVEPTADESAETPAVSLPKRPTAPPPPPPPRREAKKPTPISARDEDDDEALPPSPSEVDIDEEALGVKPPRMTVPALNKATMSLSDDDKEDIITASRDRGPLTGPTLVPRDNSSAWLRQLLESDGISAVFISGPQTVEVERDGQRETAATAPDPAALVEAVRTLASRAVPPPAPDAGLVNVTLPDGARLTALFPPLSDQLTVALQKVTPVQKSFAELVADGIASREMQQVLEACILQHRSVLVAGDHHAARAVMHALASSLPARSRVICLAESLGPPSGATAWIRLTPDARVPELLTTAAALRPDYLITEVRDATAAADVVHEGTLGHQGGIIASLSARSAGDALTRVHALAGSSLGARAGLADLVAAAFDVVVFATSLGDGNMRVLEVSEPKVDADGRLTTETLLMWKADGPTGDGGVSGRFVATGASSRLAATLGARGVQLPASVLRK